MERALIQKGSHFDEETVAQMAIEYAKIVQILTDMEVLREVTIEERRREHLFRPVMKSLTILNRDDLPVEASEVDQAKDHLFKVAQELWWHDAAIQDDALTLLITALKLN